MQLSLLDVNFRDQSERANTSTILLHVCAYEHNFSKVPPTSAKRQNRQFLYPRQEHRNCSWSIGTINV